jgi:hypothetical protein
LIPRDIGERILHPEVLGQRAAIAHKRHRQHDGEIFALDDRDGERFEISPALPELAIERQHDLGLVAFGLGFGFLRQRPHARRGYRLNTLRRNADGRATAHDEDTNDTKKQFP